MPFFKVTSRPVVGGNSVPVGKSFQMTLHLRLFFSSRDFEGKDLPVLQSDITSMSNPQLGNGR
jgi:hypothetical protein